MMDMFTVMKFTIKDVLKRKSFIISTIVLLVMIIVGFNIPNIVKMFDGENTSTLYVSDPSNAYEGYLSNVVCDDESRCLVGKVVDYDLDTLKDKVLNEEDTTAILVEKNEDNNEIKFTYVVKNAVFASKLDQTTVNMLSETYKQLQLSKLNLDEAEFRMINPVFNVGMEQAEEEAKGNLVAMMMLSIVLFYAVYFNAFQVSSAITTEKTSKIIETLVTSTSPKNIVIGKTLGIGITGLIQIMILGITAIISAKIFMDPELINTLFDLSTITWSLGLVTLVYFLLGYLAYAVLYALTGSTVSKPEDVQSANGPVSLIGVGCFYLAYFTMMSPAGELNAFAAMFPLSSPFCMPIRIMMGFASVSDVLISLVILVVTIAIIAKIAIKIYSNAILNYGTKLSIKDMISLYKQK